MLKSLEINSLYRVNHVNPPASSDCLPPRRSIFFGELDQVLKKNLEDPGFWDIKRKPIPRANGPPADRLSNCGSFLLRPYLLSWMIRQPAKESIEYFHFIFNQTSFNQ